MGIFLFRYGEPAGEVTSDTLSTLGNVITVSSNLKIITPKGLAKTAAKNTGKALVQSYKTSTQPNGNIYHAMIEPVPRSSSSNCVNSVNGVDKPSTSTSEDDVVQKKE